MVGGARDALNGEEMPSYRGSFPSAIDGCARKMLTGGSLGPTRQREGCDWAPVGLVGPGGLRFGAGSAQVSW